jgi:hypothetical protein
MVTDDSKTFSLDNLESELVRETCGTPDRSGLRSMFRELSRLEEGVRLGWLPMTRRHLVWITWSLS